MTLLASFAIAAQNQAVSQARVLEKVREVEDERLVLQSVRAVVLPLAGEMMLDENPRSTKDVSYDGRPFSVALKSAPRNYWHYLTVEPNALFREREGQFERRRKFGR